MTTYTLTIPCSCIVFVVLDAETGLAQSRVIEIQGPRCRVSRHEAGARLYLWEMLPGFRLRDPVGSRRAGDPLIY
jgi:hypothetical protein